MKILLLLMVLLPFGAYCANTLTMFHIGDGSHVLQQGQTFTANEIVVSNPNAKDIDSVKNVVCLATGTAAKLPIKVKWKVVVNNYGWSYNIDNTMIMTRDFLPTQDVVYKMIITGVIDSDSYKGPYANIKCETTS